MKLSTKSSALICQKASFSSYILLKDLKHEFHLQMCFRSRVQITEIEDTYKIFIQTFPFVSVKTQNKIITQMSLV